MSTPMLKADRGGFSLTEVLASIVILAVILVSLAGITFQAARRSVEMADLSARQATLLQEVNRLTAVPWDALPLHAGCEDITVGPHLMYRCVNLEAVTSVTTQVTITIVPQGGLSRPDSIVFRRSRPARPNPLM